MGVEVVVWLDAKHVPVVRALLDVMGSSSGGVEVLAVGGRRSAPVSELASSLDRPVDDDLRHLLVQYPASFLLLATDEPVSPTDLRAARAAGTHVLTLEPVADDVAGLVAIAGGETPTGQPQAVIASAPRFTAGPGFLSAADPYEVLGDLRTISLESLGQADQGSLFQRLLDAWHAVLAFTELPQTIDAQYFGASAERPESVRILSGRLTAHARMPGNGSAVIHVSDTAGLWSRRLRVIGEGASLEMTDTGYALTGLDGQTIDENPGPSATPATHIDLIAAQWRRLISRLSGLVAEPTWLDREKAALACCHACLLSHRTGQPESPRTILQMSR